MPDQSAPVAVVSHDAGGAEILSSYIIQQRLTCHYSLAGPAMGILERKLGPLDVVSLDEAVRQSDWLLCGTSWQSDLEWQSIKSARESGKRSVAFLDHWGNFRERFIRRGEFVIPDEVWVGDVLAEKLVKGVLPEVKVSLVGNPYFDHLTRELAAMPKLDGIRKMALTVLFVSEPLREHGLHAFGNERHWGYTEEEAIHYLLSNLEVLGQSVGRIIIRPHPSEPPHKYDWVKQVYSLPIMNGGNRTLLEEVAESDVVVGFQSMAMVVGLMAGKRVISCIPPGGKACMLPQAEIEDLQSLIDQHGKKGCLDG
jgi:hypothetical protein